MTAVNFHVTASKGADGAASEGQGKWVRSPADDRFVTRLSYRLAQGTHALETRLIDDMCACVADQGVVLPRSTIIDYYVSLKTTPFVVLMEGAADAKRALAQGVAAALVGSRSSQYVQISGGVSWPLGTGEGGYYRSLLERFDSLRFLELLNEAAMPSNLGKAYFLYLDGLHPDEINHFFSSMLWLTDEGEKRLALPGLQPTQQPVVPANVYITANVHDVGDGSRLTQQALRLAGIVDVPSHVVASDVDTHTAGRVPPVGYQRMMRDAAIHDVDAARWKLGALLGDTFVNHLRPSSDLMRIVWRSGLVLGSRALRDLTRYVANSFDRHGEGLFDQQNAQRNAQIALDIHTVRRIVWSLDDTSDPALRQDLIDYRTALLAAT